MRLERRGKDFELHPVELLKVSTPNTGAGFDVEPPRFVHIRSPGGLVAYDVSLQLPKLDKPITGVRVVFHPDPAAPGGGRGFGTLPERAGASPPPYSRSKASSKANATTHRPRHLHPHRLHRQRRSRRRRPGQSQPPARHVASVTANSWLPDCRPKASSTPAATTAGRPNASDDGPAHISPSRSTSRSTRATTPFMTVQLNFGHGDSTRRRPLRIPRDDRHRRRQRPAGRNHRDHRSAASPRASSPTSRSAALGAEDGPAHSERSATIREYFADHADATKRDRIALANLEERLDVLTEKFPTMVMDVAEKPRDTFILNRGDYAQPTEKVTAGTPAVLPAAIGSGAPASVGALARQCRPTASASPTGSRCASTRSPRASR